MKMHQRQRAQVMILFGLALPAFLALLALVLDGGNVFLQRRTAQISADAAALAGTRAMQRAPATAGTIGVDTIARGICNLAKTNAFGNVPQVTSAYFVKTDGTRTASGSDVITSVNQCPALNAPSGYPYVTIPSDAAGVHVEVSISFNTFFAGILRISNLTAQAQASAMVGNISAYDAGNSPFIVCGIDTMLRSPAGTPESILQMSGGSPVTPYRINPAADGHEFVVHGPNTHDISECGAGSSFKGLADQDENGGLTTLPADLDWEHGTRAGPTRVQVDGTNGCGPTDEGDCVMILPVATGTGPSGTLHAVLWAAFYISDHGSANYHYGVLRANYVVGSGPRAFTWSWGTPSGTAITFALTQ